MTRNGQKYAEKEYRFLFMIMLGVYYVVLLTILAVFQFKAGIPVPEPLKHDIFVKLLGGLIMFSPYYFIIKLILKKLSPIPIQTDVTPEKLKKARITLFLIFMLGALFIFLVPWTLSVILPSF